jgi:hypothetical protein
VPLVVTVLGDVVLPSSHRIPVPLAPGVAVMVAAPQYVPLPLTAGAAGADTPSNTHKVCTSSLASKSFKKQEDAITVQYRPGAISTISEVQKMIPLSNSPHTQLVASSTLGNRQPAPRL